MTDRELLHEYLEYTSDKAFTDLVRRHIDLVYWTSIRDSGDARTAEAATQDVFSLLAHKAGSIHEGTSLVDWLFERSRMMTRNVLIRELRDGRPAVAVESDDAWKRIEPVVNDAVAAMSEMDRESILLCLIEARSSHEVGEEIGATEEVAAARGAHALMSMSMQLDKRGAPIEPDALANLLKEHGAPFASIKVEAVAETAFGTRPAVEAAPAAPAPVAASAPTSRRRATPLVAAAVTIAVLAVGGIVALMLTQSNTPAPKATAPVASMTPEQAADGTTPPAVPNGSSGDPFAPKPDTSVGSVPITPQPATGSTAATKPAAPASPDVPTDANGLVVPPGGSPAHPSNQLPPMSPSQAPPAPVPAPTPAQTTPITHAPQERLMGVVTGAAPSAVMEINGSERIVSVGATVDGGKITEIADDHVTITSDDGRSRTVALASSR